MRKNGSHFGGLMESHFAAGVAEDDKCCNYYEIKNLEILSHASFSFFTV